jgi:hypothetical protein
MNSLIGRIFMNAAKNIGWTRADGEIRGINFAFDFSTVRNLAVDVRKMLGLAIVDYHRNNADFIYWFSQYDDQKLFLEDGYSSSYDFLVRGHGFSEGSAWRRIRVARLARSMPTVFEVIARGLVSFTVLSMIAEANFDKADLPKVLKDCERKSKKEAEKILALLQFRPIPSRRKRDSVRIIGSKLKGAQPEMGFFEKDKSGVREGNDTLSDISSACSQIGGAFQFGKGASELLKNDANTNVDSHLGEAESAAVSGPLVKDCKLIDEVFSAGPSVSDGASNTGTAQKELIYRVSVDVPEAIYSQLMHAKTASQSMDLVELLSKLLENYSKRLPDCRRQDRRPIKEKKPMASCGIEATAEKSHVSVWSEGTSDNAGAMDKKLDKAKRGQTCKAIKKGGTEAQAVLAEENSPACVTGGSGPSLTTVTGYQGMCGQRQLATATGGGVEKEASAGEDSEGLTTKKCITSAGKLDSKSQVSRYIPIRVRRKVWEKFGGKCGYVSELSGQRCGAVERLEFEHVMPYAKGGSHDESNLMMLCRAHNQFQAIRQFGRSKIAQWIAV